MLKLGRLTSICFVLSACVTTPNAPALKPNTVMRGVDSGVQQIIDDYYSVTPDCSNMGYPEIRVLSAPGHGSVAVEQGEAYPSFAKDNVRYDCNKSKVASSRIMYKSSPGFHGKDSFTIQVRYVNSNLRLIVYSVDVL